MIEFLPAPEAVLAFKTTGTLNGDDYDLILARLNGQLETQPRIGIVAEMVDFHGVTPEAFWKDLKFGVERIGQWNRFPHCALVTDAHWLKALAGFWDPILPGIEMKTFLPGETAQAIAWAADV